MSEATPKLYANKPGKAQIKQAQPSSSSPAASAAATAASYSMGTPAQNHPPPPPPALGKESFARRYKLLWPLLLTVNIAVGAYLFMRTSKRDTKTADEEEDSKAALSKPESSSVTLTAPVVDKSLSAPPFVQPMIKMEPIPPSQQRELFKWMLEEKRKIKTKDAEEWKHIDKDKAILKQFIRAKSLPYL